MSINFVALHDRMIITPVEKPKIKGGIILSDNDNDPWMYGIVEAVGPGLTNNMGSIMETKTKEGDVVLFYKCDGTPLEIDDVPYICLRETHVIGIYKKEQKDA